MGMKIELLEVAGFYPAVLSARSAMKSYDKCDSFKDRLGPNDRGLFERLIRAGGPHCKCIRQIQAWFAITAPRFFWQEFDTYRIGVEKGSESTMHKIASRPLTYSDFDDDEVPQSVLEYINKLIQLYTVDKNPNIFLAIKKGGQKDFSF